MVQSSDNGAPYVADNAGSKVAEVFRSIAERWTTLLEERQRTAACIGRA